MLKNQTISNINNEVIEKHQNLAIEMASNLYRDSSYVEGIKILENTLDELKIGYSSSIDRKIREGYDSIFNAGFYLISIKTPIHRADHTRDYLYKFFSTWIQTDYVDHSKIKYSTGGTHLNYRRKLPNDKSLIDVFVITDDGNDTIYKKRIVAKTHSVHVNGDILSYELNGSLIFNNLRTEEDNIIRNSNINTLYDVSQKYNLIAAFDGDVIKIYDTKKKNELIRVQNIHINNPNALRLLNDRILIIRSGTIFQEDLGRITYGAQNSYLYNFKTNRIIGRYDGIILGTNYGERNSDYSVLLGNSNFFPDRLETYYSSALTPNLPDSINHKCELLSLSENNHYLLVRSGNNYYRLSLSGQEISEFQLPVDTRASYLSNDGSVVTYVTNTGGIGRFSINEMKNLSEPQFYSWGYRLLKWRFNKRNLHVRCVSPSGIFAVLSDYENNLYYLNIAKDASSG